MGGGMISRGRRKWGNLQNVSKATRNLKKKGCMSPLKREGEETGKGRRGWNEKRLSQATPQGGGVSRGPNSKKHYMRKRKRRGRGGTPKWGGGKRNNQH